MSKLTEIISGNKYNIDSKSGFKYIDTNDLECNKRARIPSIICKCGNDSFRLQSGFYELIAHCTKCGACDVVYDG